MIESEIGSDVGTLRAIGGGAKSSRWVQVLADILRKPVEAARQLETTALGAAILAGVVADRLRSLSDAYGRLYPVLTPVLTEIGEIEAG